PAVRRSLESMVGTLTADFGLRGLNGLDFLLDDKEIRVIELNPRPPASIALYRNACPGGVLRVHVEASLGGRLPEFLDYPVRRRGFETVFAKQACEVGPPAAEALAQRTWCHDLPAAGTQVARG